MKYINMMAGAFGLMALAACSNNDEVTVEQPQVARTLTVTLGNGADTRLTFSEFDANEGIKGSWESTDEIGVQFSSISEPLIYKADGEGPTTTFTLVGETGPQENAPYRVVYPVSYAYGYDFSKQSGLHADLKNWAYASAEDVRFKNNQSENKITLTPLCSFIRIPAGTIFNSLNEIPADFSSAYFEFQGSGLFPVFNPDMEEGEMYEGKIVIDPAENKLLGLMDKEIKATTDIYIALPLTDGSITSMYLKILAPTIATTKASVETTVVTFEIVKNNDEPVLITDGGKIYTLASENLKLLK